jgi:hypothetical protein
MLIGKGMGCKGCRWEVVVSSLIDRNPMDAGSRTKDWPLWFLFVHAPKLHLASSEASDSDCPFLDETPDIGQFGHTG